MHLTHLFTAAFLYVLLPGCGGHDHEHGEGGHTHGADGEHVHAALFGGQLNAIEDEVANLEVVLEAEAGIARLHLLDAHCVNPVRVAQHTMTVSVQVGDQEFTVEAPARENPLSNEKAGDSHEFVVTHEALKGATEFSGTIAKVEMQGSTYENVAFAYTAE